MFSPGFGDGSMSLSMDSSSAAGGGNRRRQLPHQQMPPSASATAAAAAAATASASASASASMPHEAASPLPPSFSDRLSPSAANSRESPVLPDGAPGPWDIRAARRSLRSSTRELSQRGLKVAARWASEQLVGLAPPRASDGDALSPPTSAPTLTSAASDLELHAQSLLEVGEYRAAAATLSESPADTLSPDRAGAAAAGVAAGSIHGEGGDGERGKRLPSAVSAGDLATGPPLPRLSPYGTYLRAYGLYMAGERRKEEETIELRDPLDRATDAVCNTSLTQLASELYHPYVEGALDAFGLYVYGIVLKALRTASAPAATAPSSVAGRSPTSVTLGGSNRDILDQPPPPPAHFVLIESLLTYPYNWSAWLDLSDLCLDDPAVHPDVEDRLRPISGHWMYHFFCVHVFLENQANENAIAVIERLVNGNAGEEDDEYYADDEDEDRQENDAETRATARQRFQPDGMFVRSPYLQSQLAVAHYNLRDFDEAQGHFVALSERYPDRIDQMDVYSNILYVKEDRVTLSALAHRAVRVDKYRPETCCIVGNYYSLKGRHERAVTYFQRALKLDPSYLSAWTLMGHEYVEMKNAAAAVEAYRRAVDINPRDYRAWYGLGQTYEILDMLLYALFYYRRAATLRPYDARMWCAMGGCYLGLGRRADAVRAYERAVSNHDAEGIATRKLAELYSEDGDVEGAARCYLRHLELRFQAQGGTGHLVADGGAGADGNEDTMPSIETIVNLVEVDAAEAEALLYLGYYHRDNGEYDTAAACCSRLLEYPGPEKEEGKALLREIRSRMNRKGAATTRAFSSRRESDREKRTFRNRGADGGDSGEYLNISESDVAPESSFEFSP